MNARHHDSIAELDSSNTQPPQRDEFADFLTLASMGKLRLDQLLYQCDVLHAAGRTTDVIHLYQQWIVNTDAPNKELALFNYGSALQSLGQTHLAEVAYRECAQINPRLVQATINLGLVLESQGRDDEAIEEWTTVVAKGLLHTSEDKSMEIMALNHIGRVYEKLKKYDLAEQALTQSLQLNPKQNGVIQHWVHIRQKACSWPVYKPLAKVSANDMLMYTSPLAMLSLRDDPVIQLLSAHAFVGRTYGFEEKFLCKGRVYKHAKKRIGYLSGDMCTHAVGLLMADFLEHHDRNKFEIYGFDYSPEDGTSYRNRLKASFDHFIPVGPMKDQEVAELILANEIDILIDMHGLSSGARPGICAMHPAPLQGTYLGYIGTTAMPWLDFVVADREVLPEVLTPYFTEKPLYVDGSFIPFNKAEVLPQSLPREELGFDAETFVMAAFGNVYKINQELLEAWIEMLKRAPNSVLWLMDDNHYTTEQLKKKFKSYGVAENRVVFSPRCHYNEYLSRLKAADVFLDSYPYNCGSTTHDVLNCGLPIVSLRGKTMVARMGASMLNALGLNELITDNFESYIQVVTKIAADKSYQRELANSITSSMQRKQNNPHLLTASFERELLEHYETKIQATDHTF